MKFQEHGHTVLKNTKNTPWLRSLTSISKTAVSNITYNSKNTKCYEHLNSTSEFLLFLYIWEKTGFFVTDDYDKSMFYGCTSLFPIVIGGKMFT